MVSVCDFFLYNFTSKLFYYISLQNQVMLRSHCHYAWHLKTCCLLLGKKCPCLNF